MTTRQQIVAYAREILGQPYNADRCAAVPLHVAGRLGIDTNSILVDWREDPDPLYMRQMLDKHLARRVHLTTMQPGDVVWLRMDQLTPLHLGVLGDYLYGGLSLIHAWNGRKLDKVVEHRLDPQWLSRIAGAWRFSGVE